MQIRKLAIALERAWGAVLRLSREQSAWVRLPRGSSEFPGRYISCVEEYRAKRAIAADRDNFPIYD